MKGAGTNPPHGQNCNRRDRRAKAVSEDSCYELIEQPAFLNQPRPHKLPPPLRKRVPRVDYR